MKYKYFVIHDKCGNAYKLEVPLFMVDEFVSVLYPWLKKEFNKSTINCNQFGWIDIIIYVAIAAVTTYMSYKASKKAKEDAISGYWNWKDFIAELKRRKLIKYNDKFVYCHHCDNITYRVWLDDEGTLQYAERPYSGRDPRFNCGLLPQQVLDLMPVCDDGSYPVHDRTGKSKGYPPLELIYKEADWWQKIKGLSQSLDLQKVNLVLSAVIGIITLKNLLDV